MASRKSYNKTFSAADDVEMLGKIEVGAEPVDGDKPYRVSPLKRVALTLGLFSHWEHSRVVTIEKTKWKKFYKHPNFWLVVLTLVGTLLLSPTVMYEFWKDSLPTGGSLAICDPNSADADVKMKILDKEYRRLSNYDEAKQQVELAKKRIQQAQAVVYLAKDGDDSGPLIPGYPLGCGQDILREKLSRNIYRTCPRTVCQPWSVSDTVTGSVDTEIYFDEEIQLEDEFRKKGYKGPYGITNTRKGFINAMGISLPGGWFARSLISWIGNLNKKETLTFDIFDFIPRTVPFKYQETRSVAYAQDVEYSGTVCKEIIEPCPSTEGLEELIEYAGFERDRDFNLERFQEAPDTVSVVVNDGIQKAVDLFLYRVDVASLLYNGYLIFILMIAPPLILTVPSWKNRVVGSALNPGKAMFILIVLVLWFGLEFIQSPEVQIWYRRLSADSCQVSVSFNKRRAEVVTEVCNEINELKSELEQYAQNLEDIIDTVKLHKPCLMADQWYNSSYIYMDEDFESDFPFDYPGLWFDFTPTQTIPNENVSKMLNMSVGSSIPEDFLLDFGFLSARVELQKPLVAQCSASALLKTSYLESESVPIAFVLTIVAMMASALLSPCLMSMFRNCFAHRYPLKALYRGKVEVYNLPSEFQGDPNELLTEEEKQKIAQSARIYVSLTHHFWGRMAFVFVLIGLLTRTGIFYRQQVATPSSKFDNRLTDANFVKFSPITTFQNGNCYSDSENSLGNTAMKVTAWEGLSNCRALCKSRDYEYYGVEKGNLCRCSQHEPDPRRLVDKSKCNLKGCFSRESGKCLGIEDSVGYMGGENHVTMYKTEFMPFYSGACYRNYKSGFPSEIYKLDYASQKLPYITQDSAWIANFTDELINLHGPNYREVLNITDIDFNEGAFEETEILTLAECEYKCGFFYHPYYTQTNVDTFAMLDPDGLGSQQLGHCRCLDTLGDLSDRHLGSKDCSDYNSISDYQDGWPSNEQSASAKIYQVGKQFQNRVINEGCYLKSDADLTPAYSVNDLESCRLYCRDKLRMNYYALEGTSLCYCTNNPPPVGANVDDTVCTARTRYTGSSNMAFDMPAGKINTHISLYEVDYVPFSSGQCFNNDHLCLGSKSREFGDNGLSFCQNNPNALRYVYSNSVNYAYCSSVCTNNPDIEYIGVSESEDPLSYPSACVCIKKAANEPTLKDFERKYLLPRLISADECPAYSKRTKQVVKLFKL